ncbi:MAG: VOC family protein [Dehalococcoidia bacterium]|nr:VOC family protein [Dehalococcoidia bacterium]
MNELIDVHVVGRLVAVTVVTPDIEASRKHYHGLLGWDRLGSMTLGDDAPVIDGQPLAGRRMAMFGVAGSDGGIVRCVEGPADAPPNRPRGVAKPWDPGLAVLEFHTSDPDASYARVSGGGAPTISPPLPYGFENAGTLGTISVRSYAAFGPAGEEMFITKAEGGRMRAPLPTLHGPVGNVVLPCLDRSPVLAFYRMLLGIIPTVDSVCRQETVNQIIGAPPDTQFQMIMLGPPDGRIGIEVEEYVAPSGQLWPTSFGRLGLTMATFRVNDLAAARRRCAEAGAPIVGEGALPLPTERRPNGFVVRGTLGELVEIIG